MSSPLDGSGTAEWKRTDVSATGVGAMTSEASAWLSIHHVRTSSANPGTPHVRTGAVSLLPASHARHRNTDIRRYRLVVRAAASKVEGRPLTGGAPRTRKPWRCRESNPGPSSPCQGFSERSSLCLYSAPPITRASRSDGPSRDWSHRTSPATGLDWPAFSLMPGTGTKAFPGRQPTYPPQAARA